MSLLKESSLRAASASKVTTVTAGKITAMRRKSMARAHARACHRPVSRPGFKAKRTKV